MLEENLNFFALICRTAMGGVVVHWDSKNHKLLTVGNLRNQLKRHKWKCTIYILYVLLLIVQYYTITYCTNQWTDSIVFGVTLVSNVTSCMCSISLQKNASASCTFVNGLLSFARIHKHVKSHSNRNYSEILSLCLAKILYLSILLFPLINVFGLHWSNPCKPAIAGYWLIGQCRIVGGYKDLYFDIISGVQKVFVLIVNYFIWMFGMKNLILACCGLLILCPHSLQDGLKR